MLRRAAGTGAVMAEQLRQVVTASRQPNVSVRVLPFSIGLHRTVRANGGFTILEFPDDRLGRRTEPPIVYSEGLTGAIYLEKPHEVESHAAVWRDIAADSLSEAQSRMMIASIAEEYAA